MVDQEEVLQIVKNQGPVLPADVKREADGNTTVIGALLSQLVDDEKIQMSNTKVGGSPVYYVESQKKDLQDLKEQLNDKQQKAFDLLRDNQVLRDNDQEPVIRAALRTLEDFAKPLEVTTDDDEKEVFWKWYLTDDEDARKRIEASIQSEDSEEEDQATSNDHDDTDEESRGNGSETKQEVAQADEETQDKPVLEDIDDEFIQKVRDFLYDNDITIVEEDIIRKGSEVDYILDVPSAIGDIRYYAKAKGKKKCNDGDLSSAFIQGESKNLPVLFLLTGDLTQQAQEMLKDEFKSMTLKRINR